MQICLHLKKRYLFNLPMFIEVKEGLTSLFTSFHVLHHCEFCAPQPAALIHLNFLLDITLFKNGDYVMKETVGNEADVFLQVNTRYKDKAFPLLST